MGKGSPKKTLYKGSIIYWYDEPNDTVYIEDIWDTRRAPQNLAKRIKN
jgi:hypothetical protein